MNIWVLSIYVIPYIYIYKIKLYDLDELEDEYLFNEIPGICIFYVIILHR